MAVHKFLSITILATSLAAAVCTGLVESENDTNVTETEVVITMSPTVAPTMPTTTFTVAITAPSVDKIPTVEELIEAAKGDTGATVDVVVIIKVQHDFTFPAGTDVDLTFARKAVAAMFNVAVSQVTIVSGRRRLSVDGRELTAGTSFSSVIATTDRAKATSVGETASVAQAFVTEYKVSADMDIEPPTVAEPVFKAAIEYVVVSADADVQIEAPTAEQFKENLVAANSDYSDLVPEVTTPAPTQAPTLAPTLAPGDTNSPTPTPTPSPTSGPTPSPPSTTSPLTTAPASTTMATATEAQTTVSMATTTATATGTSPATASTTAASTTAANMTNQTTSAGNTEESLASVRQAWSFVALVCTVLRM